MKKLKKGIEENALAMLSHFHYPHWDEGYMTGYKLVPEKK